MRVHGFSSNISQVLTVRQPWLEILLETSEPLTEGVLQKKGCFLIFLQISQENTCVGNSFNKGAGPEACNFIKKNTPTQVLSHENCEIFKKTYFEGDLQVTASKIFCYFPE